MHRARDPGAATYPVLCHSRTAMSPSAATTRVRRPSSPKEGTIAALASRQPWSGTLAILN